MDKLLSFEIFFPIAFFSIITIVAVGACYSDERRRECVKTVVATGNFTAEDVRELCR